MKQKNVRAKYRAPLLNLGRPTGISIVIVLVLAVAIVGYFGFRMTHAPSAYDTAVLNDHPVAYWAMSNAARGNEPDLTGNGHAGTYKGGIPKSVSLPDGQQAADFNGSTQYLTVPSSRAFSIPTTGQLTWEAWIKPDKLQYASSYTDWMGKCQGYSPTCEWEARMYSTVNSQSRCNRLSAYVFNLRAGLGSSADWQPNCHLLRAGQWLYVVGEYQTHSQPPGCHGPQIGGINIWVNGVEWDQSYHLQTGCMSQYGITPTASTSPLNIGTMALDYWFPGAVGKVAIYNYLLSQAQISTHFTAMTGTARSGFCANTCTIPARGQT
jgi:hypothetical protein